MITVTKNEHNIRAIAHDPTKDIRTAVYVGPDGDYIEEWFNPMFCDRTYLRVDPILATRDDAWLKTVGTIEEFIAAPAARLCPHAGEERDLHAMLFERGWRVEERFPYTGPKGQMEWNKYNEESLFDPREEFHFWTGDNASR